MCSNVCSKSSIDAIWKRFQSIVWRFNLSIHSIYTYIYTSIHRHTHSYTHTHKWKHSHIQLVVDNSVGELTLSQTTQSQSVSDSVTSANQRTLVFHVKLFQNNLFTYLVWIRAKAPVLWFVCVYKRCKYRAYWWKNSEESEWKRTRRKDALQCNRVFRRLPMK